jgi:hypothetical protein
VKIDVIELISPGVFSRGRDCHRVVIDRNHALCSEACRRQRENSRTRPKVEQRSFRFWGAQSASLLGSAASRTFFKEFSSASCRRVQAGSLRSPERSNRASYFTARTLRQ